MTATAFQQSLPISPNAKFAQPVHAAFTSKARQYMVPHGWRSDSVSATSQTFFDISVDSGGGFDAKPKLVVDFEFQASRSPAGYTSLVTSCSYAHPECVGVCIVSHMGTSSTKWRSLPSSLRLALAVQAAARRKG